MGAVLKRIDDPRDALERARRLELVNFARANGVKEINPEMPAILMRKILRGKNLTGIAVPDRRLGMPENATAQATMDTAASANEINAEDDLARQFAQQKAAPMKRPAQMSINELGAEMKRLKIKRGRRDNMTTMRAKIEQHGQDAT